MPRTHEHAPADPTTRPGTPKAVQQGPQRRTRRLRHDPGLAIARDLATTVPWLRSVRLGRIAPMLNKIARAGWSPTQVQEAMDAVNRRLNYNSPAAGAVKTPWAMLAWYLGQLDPIADHPKTGPLFADPTR